VLVAIVAPLVLSGYFELGVALVLLALLISARLRGAALLGGIAVAVTTVVLVTRAAQEYSEGVRVMERDFYGVVRTVDHQSPVPYRSMYHGAIMHGGQLLGDSFRNVPADYFGPGSGYGRVFFFLERKSIRKNRCASASSASARA
jgi:hypothetical protein